MAGWTNKGKYKVLGWAFRAETPPTVFYVALVTSTTVPTADTNTLGQLTEIAAGNGYASGGSSIARSAVGFDVWTEDDVNDRGLIQVKDVVWTASGGPIPASGLGARYAILTDDNVTIASREVYGYWDLVSDRTVSAGQTLTLQDCELRINET